MAEFDLTKKVGPLPLWGWGLAVAGVGFFVISRKQKAATEAGGGGNGGGQFSSTVTSKDAAGNTTTYTASGPNSGISSPAQFSWGAGPMGYSDGDVYVNYPGPGAAGPPGPQGPPGPAGPPGQPNPPMPRPPRNPDWGKWETVVNGDSIQALTARVLGTGDFWSQVWNDPVNKAVHDLRGTPGNLQPGDVVWVFNGWKPGWKPPADFVPYQAPSRSLPQTAVVPPPPDPSQN